MTTTFEQAIALARSVNWLHRAWMPFPQDQGKAPNRDNCYCGAPATRWLANERCCDECYRRDKQVFDHAQPGKKMRGESDRKRLEREHARKRSKPGERVFDYEQEAGGLDEYPLHLKLTSGRLAHAQLVDG
jgi:hypothetical protein